METEKELKNILEKPSIFCNVVPYLGYYDQVYLIFQKLNKNARASFNSVEKVLRETILLNNFRIHPGFLDTIDYSPKQITKYINDIKFTSINIRYVGDWLKFNEKTTKYREILSLKNTLIKSQLYNWQINNDTPALNCLDVLEYSNYNGDHKLDNLIQALNQIACPVNSITYSFSNNNEAPEIELNEVTKNSVKIFKIRTDNNSKGELLGLKERIIELFPNLQRIICESNVACLEWWISSYNYGYREIVDEYFSNSYMYDTRDGFHFILKSKNSQCYQIENGKSPLTAKFENLVVRTDKVIPMTTVIIPSDSSQEESVLSQRNKNFSGLQSLSDYELNSAKLFRKTDIQDQNLFYFPADKVTESTIEVNTSEDANCINRILDVVNTVSNTNIN